MPFVLAVVANILYSTACAVDIFVQASVYRDAWRRLRGLLPPNPFAAEPLMSDTPDASELLARVAHLERRQRVLQPFACLAVIVLAVVLGFTRGDPRTMQAERIELVNAGGEVRAAFSADTAGVLLTLFQKGGRAAGSLRLNDAPRLTLLDGTGREVAGLGAPRVQHLAQ
jgi:hypothetical protein